jgi:two-component sensor histidine kinase
MPPANNPVRILYIDDDVGLGILLSKALAPSFYAVEAVVSGEEALVRLATAPYDLVALDHNLVNELGLDLIPRIRAMPDAPPIIYVTGSEDARIAVAALKAGAVDYVWKDVQGHYRELLGQSIKTALEQEKLRRESEVAQREIRTARDRAETLLREVNHRVANSLAIVTTFVQMQANAISDPEARDMLRETQARIAAIAAVHRRLYTSTDVRSVEVNVYLASLAEELAATMNVERRSSLRLVTAPSEIALATDKAIALGVIVTELVTNAYKYAYGAGGGEIRIRASAEGSRLTVAVEDDGVGWTGEGEIKGSGLGSRIIRAMAQTAQAEVAYHTSHGGGTRAVISVPV